MSIQASKKSDISVSIFSINNVLKHLNSDWWRLINKPQGFLYYIHHIRICDCLVWRCELRMQGVLHNLVMVSLYIHHVESRYLTIECNIYFSFALWSSKEMSNNTTSRIKVFNAEIFCHIRIYNQQNIHNHFTPFVTILLQLLSLNWFRLSYSFKCRPLKITPNDSDFPYIDRVFSKFLLFLSNLFLDLFTPNYKAKSNEYVFKTKTKKLTVK